MDRNQKSLQLLGPFGIMVEAFIIIHSQAKLLGIITRVFILPLTLINLVCSLMLQLLLVKIISNEITEVRKLPILQLTEFLVLLTVYSLLSYAVLMPSMAAVVYTVANVDRGNHKPSMAAVIKLVPAVWKQMMMTCLSYFIIHFVICTAFAFAVCLVVLGFVVFNKWYEIVFRNALMFLSVVFVQLSVYEKLVWQVATVMSVMEEGNYGWKGIEKSHRLLEGKLVTGCVLTISYLVFNSLLGCTVFMGNIYVVGLGPRTAFGAACVVMGCVVALMGMLSQTMFYFVCKAYHGESIDGYPGEYQAVKNKDVESLEPSNI